MLRFTDPKRLGARLAAAALVLNVAAIALAAPSGPPVRIGGTLALTGPLAATAMIHKIVGEMYVDRLNKGEGLLGRPVEWVLLDDQSKADVTRTLYEKLVTTDKVDLLIGPYATNNILAAFSVAERHNKTLVHHTFGIPKLAKYERHFSTNATGYDFETTTPSRVFDALKAGGQEPKTVAVVTSKFSSVHFLSVGAREQAKKRGYKEALYLEYEFGNRDFGPIAARIREANADFLWVGAIGLDGNMLLEALKKIDYIPRTHFYLYPAPGPLANSPDANLALSYTVFEGHAPFTNDPVGGEFTKNFRERAAKAGLPYTEPEVQAANSFAAWQVIEAAVTATKSFDDKVLAQWLKTNKVRTVLGTLRFDGQNNFGDDLAKVRQLQNKKWVVVYPPEFAAPGAKMMGR